MNCVLCIAALIILHGGVLSAGGIWANPGEWIWVVCRFLSLPQVVLCALTVYWSSVIYLSSGVTEYDDYFGGYRAFAGSAAGSAKGGKGRRAISGPMGGGQPIPYMAGGGGMGGMEGYPGEQPGFGFGYGGQAVGGGRPVLATSREETV